MTISQIIIKYQVFKIITILVVFLAIYSYFQSFMVKRYTSVIIGKTMFFAEVVKTPEEKQKGLAGHIPLKDNEGMLFVFQPGEGSAIWMKGMTFPIDIVWIKDNKVSYVVENAPIPKAGQTDSKLPIYNPPGPADYVLEINSGLVKKNDIKVGDIFINNQK